MNELVDTGAAPAPSALDRWLRRRLCSHLGGLRHGRLRVHDAEGELVFGQADGGLDIRITVDDMAFWRALAGGGSVGAAESYMAGQWHCDDLVGLVRLLVRNRDLLDGMESGLARLGGIALRGWNALRRNTRDGSRRNVAAHYDLGNEFFRLFLSDDLMYSSAWFATPDETLEAASWRKLERICRQLDLRPGDRVLEIGTGWGGFALHAAGRYGCHVTTTTLSREQHALAGERVAAAGLQDRVTLLTQDYRDLAGRYDRIVSIEMIEAIGPQYLDTYFAKLSALLHPEGVALLQAITIEDHRYVQARDSVDFIKRHVFPGSFIPSVSAMLAAKTRASDLQLLRMDDFGPSYALTLRAWRQRFLARLGDVHALGFDARFVRLWDFYLAYCEGGFLERSIGVAHLLLGKPGHVRATAAGSRP